MKCRRIFRAIYAAATGVARVNATNGQKIFSAAFKVERGVVQGDIISPILFILALDQLVRTHDQQGSGIGCGPTLNVRVLGYADDAAMLERDVDVMSTRLTALADGAKKDADMQVKMSKTFSQHVGRKETVAIGHAEAVAAQKEYKNECEFCARKFKTKRAVKIHATSCAHRYGTTEEYFDVEKITGVFGRLGQRWFLVKYEGHPQPE